MRIYYVFDCMNAFLENKLFQFCSDDEAIEFGINYEADVYKIIVNSEEITKKCIHSTEWKD